VRRGTTQVRLKRIYEPPASEDRLRVLVDRIWPRGVSKAAARVDLWAKDLAPSDRLRRWFAHDPARFKEFRSRYLAELRDRDEELEALGRHARHTGVTLLFAARDEAHNNAVVLAEALRRRISE
jgi:uncharacterized protein YeaO (DUF488 family)